MAHLAVTLLGPLCVTLDSVPLTTFRSRKAQALLAFLAAESHRPHARESLAALLWPDRPDAKALRSLSYTLSRLRRVIGDRDASPPFLAITRDTLQLTLSSHCTCDLAEFTACIKANRLDVATAESLRRGLDLYGGTFLEGFALNDSAPFEEWALSERERLARLALEAGRRLAEHHQALGEWEETAHYARQQLHLDPWDEGAHRVLMRALTLAGHRGAALAHYDACRHQLVEELGVDPDSRTQALYAQILQGTLEHQTTVPLPRTPPAVLQPPPSTTRPPVQRFAGRNVELGALKSHLDAVIQGQARVAFVVGEPGSGKTYLL